LPDDEAIRSPRFIARSLIPHVKGLSSRFNREEGEPLEPYWKDTGNRENLRLAYFLYFMPANLFRAASVWGELHRLGYRWPDSLRSQSLRAIELGAGPAAGATGIAAGESHTPLGLPGTGDWALIEQDRATLELGSEWAKHWFESQALGGWGTRPFHRKLQVSAGLLPKTAPKFHLWLSSFFLNELSESPAEIARALLEAWERHLAEDGLAILIEPALKPISRKLLEVRNELLALAAGRAPWMKLLLPCLGHQACGALAAAEDWCHEEVSWWRPPYYKQIDQLAGLDRKTLPFSYLVVARSRRTMQELLPELSKARTLHRLVSPAHKEGRDPEFFLCGQDGKVRARLRTDEEIERGDILADAEIRGDEHASRVERISQRF
jgi:hypothetical protein